MGLDLMLYKRNQWEAEHAWCLAEEERRKKENDPVFHSYPEELEELAYGRKTWSIYNFFSLRPDSTKLDEDVYEITKDAYLDFCARVELYKYYLEAIYNSGDNETELDEDVAEFIYDKIFSDTFEISPQLGYIWDCCAIYRWAFVQRDIIMKAFDEGPVIIYASW